MKERLISLKEEAVRLIFECKNKVSLEKIKVSYLGKKGKLTQILKGLGALSPQERAESGAIANQTKVMINEALDRQKKVIEKSYYKELSETEWYDMTATAPEFPKSLLPFSEKGHVHPISQAQKKLEEVFTSMGFSIFDGPQVEEDFYNFGALNFSEDHPAREVQDTFYTKDGHLLRTHTSSVQIRGLQDSTPPLKMIAPGRVFRHEEVDASHEHTFYQMEGMVIDEKVSISNLLFLMKTLLKELFEKKVKIRLRPGYFPFVEPGFELDMSCLLCNQKGCSVCMKTGWVEVLPCGLVHPNVIKACGLAPSKWQGAAFGLGLNRIVMMSEGIEDIRHFQSNHLDFLRQF